MHAGHVSLLIVQAPTNMDLFGEQWRGDIDFGFYFLFHMYKTVKILNLSYKTIKNALLKTYKTEKYLTPTYKTVNWFRTKL
jgi:hypothetical protein